MYTTEPLSHFTDEYLDFLYESLPTAASGDGVHVHDDRIEELSRSAIEAQARELGGFARRLDRISTRSLTAEEQLERRMLADQIRGRLFELEEVRPWERDPQHYAELLATSLAGQTLFEYAPLEERARRIVSKLRQTPRLIEAAETKIQDPPGIFIKLGAEAFDGVGTFIEGWAHYCEQMMMDAGLGRDDDTLELGQIAEALVRLVRMVIGIKLHTEDMSVEQGVRLFREQAYLEEGSARREAERGTFDPAYVLYAAGRLMLLKLREDLQTREGSRFSLKSFHDRLLGQGSLPLWLHRTLLLGDTGDELLD